MARQLAFDLPVIPALGRDDLLVGASNGDAVAMIEAWPLWPDRLMGLSGPAGSGKSHLAAIWAERSGAPIVAAQDIVAEAVPELAAGALVVEDLDRGRPDGAALFHLVNLARERQRSLLFTAATPLDSLALGPADLRSRLRLAPAITIGPPDDGLLRAVLVKLFHDRQVTVEAGVIEFLALRIERSFAAAADIVRALDREALSRGRRVARPLAAAVLQAMAGGEHHPSVTSEA